MGVARTVLAMAVALAGGCQSILGLDTPGMRSGPDAPEPDAPIDAPILDVLDGPIGSLMIDGFNLTPYNPSVTPIVFDANITINTGVIGPCTLINQTGTTNPACLIYASEVRIEAGVTVTASGTLPMIIAATGAVKIDGILKAEGGLDVAGCAAASVANSGTIAGLGGGAGGSFGGRGGDGGDGDAFASNGASAVGPTATPSVIRGGCRGGNGGTYTGTGGPGGTGRSSGGGVWILGLDQVQVTAQGQVLANGIGAPGGGQYAGGGGGGSGGYIRIAAHNTVVIAGILAANGGGGGEGGGTAVGSVGGTAQNGSASVQQASGGSLGSSPGGDGGAGGAWGAALSGYPGDNNGGGGGGGGGAGLVVINGSVTGSVEVLSNTISPMPL